MISREEETIWVATKGPRGRRIVIIVPCLATRPLPPLSWPSAHDFLQDWVGLYKGRVDAYVYMYGEYFTIPFHTASDRVALKMMMEARGECVPGQVPTVREMIKHFHESLE